MSAVSAPDSESRKKLQGNREGSGSHPEALAMAIFFKLKKQLGSLQEELTPTLARELIHEAVYILPEFHAEENGEEEILLYPVKGGSPIPLQLKGAVDSLLLIWKEFEERRGRDGGK